MTPALCHTTSSLSACLRNSSAAGLTVDRSDRSMCMNRSVPFDAGWALWISEMAAAAFWALRPRM